MKIKYSRIIFLVILCFSAPVYCDKPDVAIVNSDFDFMGLMEEINAYEVSLTGKDCSMDMADDLAYLLNLYEVFNYKGQAHGLELGDDVLFFMLYSKLGYIYSKSGDTLSSDYFYKTGLDYGLKFDKRLSDEERVYKLIKRASLGCKIPD